MAGTQLSSLGSPARMPTPPNLKQLAAAFIRQEIFSGRYKPGEKIDQDALTGRLGFSKLPIREALISLENEGIVENVPRRGSFVANLTREDILDHYSLIALASGIAANRAAGTLSADQLEVLDETLVELDQTVSPVRMNELNDNFHRVINQAGGTLRLRSALRLFTQTMPENFYEFAEGWNESAAAQHRSIFAALRDGNHVQAEQAMVSHIRSGGQYAVKRLEEVGFWS